MFFGYFLNIKKVTPSADFVIGPAKAEAFLFSHTRLPFPPRPLLPFGRISPAAKPGWPVTGPAGAAILPFPSRLRRAGAPTAKPRRLSPFGSISLRETARSVVASAGAGTGSRVWEKRKAPRCRGDDYESPTAYFLSIKKVGKER